VVHPPAGIAGGDELEMNVRADSSAHALLTTPGAGKWYRSAGPWARQHIAFDIAAGASVEWLPQETIVFDGALASLRTDVRLAREARFIGWDIFCFGRSGSGERFARGELRARIALEREGRPFWLERVGIDGGSAALDSPAVLAGHSVAGTLLAAAPAVDTTVLNPCRALQPTAGAGAVTLLPGLLVARYLGDSSEAARNYFVELWRILRPVLFGRAAQEPRIWRT
jgi:urease accessory protein